MHGALLGPSWVRVIATLREDVAEIAVYDEAAAARPAFDNVRIDALALDVDATASIKVRYACIHGAFSIDQLSAFVRRSAPYLRELVVRPDGEPAVVESAVAAVLVPLPECRLARSAYFDLRIFPGISFSIPDKCALGYGAHVVLGRGATLHVLDSERSYAKSWSHIPLVHTVALHGPVVPADCPPFEELVWNVATGVTLHVGDAHFPSAFSRLVIKAPHSSTVHFEGPHTLPATLNHVVAECVVHVIADRFTAPLVCLELHGHELTAQQAMHLPAAHRVLLRHIMHPRWAAGGAAGGDLLMQIGCVDDNAWTPEAPAPCFAKVECIVTRPRDRVVLYRAAKTKLCARQRWTIAADGTTLEADGPLQSLLPTQITVPANVGTDVDMPCLHLGANFEASPAMADLVNKVFASTGAAAMRLKFGPSMLLWYCANRARFSPGVVPVCQGTVIMI